MAIKNWFADGNNSDGFAQKHKQVFIDYLLDTVIAIYPLLGYFRNHLENKLVGIVKATTTNQSATLDGNTIDAILTGIRDFIMTKVPTSLVIGGAPNNASKNSDYPNLNSYLYFDRVTLDRSEIQNVYSILNARNEIVKALQSTPFFGTYLTWMDTFGHVGDGNLF